MMALYVPSADHGLRRFLHSVAQSGPLLREAPRRDVRCEDVVVARDLIASGELRHHVDERRKVPEIAVDALEIELHPGIGGRGELFGPNGL